MYRIRDVIDMATKGIPEKYRGEIWMTYSGTQILLLHVLFEFVSESHGLTGRARARAGYGHLNYL